MNFKKIIATVAAAAVAVTTMAVNTFAIKDYPDGVVIDLIAEGYSVLDVYGFTFTISGDIDSGVGGGVGFNSASTGWEQHDWGNADAGKELNGSEGKLTVLKTSPVFKESDITDPSNPYAQVWMQQWWGTDIVFEGVEILGADGVVLSPVEKTEEAPADEAAPADEDTAADEVAADDVATDDADDEAAADDVATDEAAADDVATDDADDVDVDADEADDADDVATDDADVDADEADDADDVATDDADDADAAADDADAAADDADAADTTADAPAADADTTASSTGNTSAAVILSVMAVAGAAAIVAKKRK